MQTASRKRAGKSKLRIPGIILAVVITGAAVYYNKQTADNFELGTDQIPARGQTIRYRYLKKTRTHTGKKRRADCYIISEYKNQSGETIDPGCVKSYHKDALCAVAECVKRKGDE